MSRSNPLTAGRTKAAIARNIATLKREGYPQAQAVAIALREARTPGRSLPHTQRRNSAQSEYDKGLEVFGRASRRFDQIRAAYRRGDISDTVFAKAQAVFDRADAAFDKLDAGLKKNPVRKNPIANRRRNPALYRYSDGRYLRPATRDELARSIRQGKRDGGSGVITVDGESVYAMHTGDEKATRAPRKRNYSYPDIASIKKVLGAAYVNKLVTMHFPRLAMDAAYKKFSAAGQPDKAAAVVALEKYHAKARDARRRKNPFGADILAGAAYPVAADAVDRIAMRTQRMFNPPYPDIASIKKVLGAAYVSKLINMHFPRLAMDAAYKRFSETGQPEKAQAVLALEGYFGKAKGAHKRVVAKRDRAHKNPAAKNGTVVYKEYKGFKILTHGGRSFSSPAAGVGRLPTVPMVERAIDKAKKNPSSSTSSDVRSPTKTSTSTYARTAGNITVTGGAGAGATTRVVVRRNPKSNSSDDKWTAGITKLEALRDKAMEAYKQTPLDRGLVKKDAALARVKAIDARISRAYTTLRRHKERTVKDYGGQWGGGDGRTMQGGRHGRGKLPNPSVLDISEMFQGDASGKTVELKAANGAPANLSRAGKLASLKLADKRANVRIPGAVVCIDTKKRLWLAGPRAPMFTKKARKGEGLDYGEIDAISYVTAKAHVGNGKTFEYVHQFGEDGGRKPHLIVDDEGMAIIKGGDYQIREEGIID